MPDPIENPPPAPWRDALLIVLLAPALVAGCYSAAFLEYDDSAHYAHEQVMSDYPLADIWRPTHSTYFPVTVLSYRIDRFLFESVPPAPLRRSKAAPGVRFHSLLLHVLAGIFLWRALLLLKLGRWMSLFAAAAWTVHPMACESICWISERKNVLAAFFGFASLWVYFGGLRRPWPRVLATAALFLLGMLSKPTAAGFLPIYVLYDMFRTWQRCHEPADALPLSPRERADEQPYRSRGVGWRAQSARVALLYIACAIVILFLTNLNLRMTEDSNVARAGGSLWTVALTDVPILAQYIYNALVPASLSIFYYSAVVTSLASGLLWASALFLVLAISGTVWISPQRARTLFLWGWFVGALGPALNIVPIPYLMQDRYAYFSLPALLIIAAETAVQLALRIRSLSRSTDPSAETAGEKPRAGMAAWATIGATLCVASMAVLRSGVYRNDFELLSDAVLKQPQSAYAHLHYALTLSGATDISEYSGRGDPAAIRAAREEALRHLLLCEQCGDFDRMLDPGRVRILVAVLNERLGRLDVAYPALVNELKLPQKPYNVAVGCLSLARMELARERPDAGLIWLEHGMKSMGSPKPSPELLYLKGLCLEKLKRFQEARAAYGEIPQGSLAFDRAQARLAKLPQ